MSPLRAKIFHSPENFAPVYPGYSAIFGRVFRYLTYLTLRTMTVSVVVPVHAGGNHFGRCLQALAQAQPAPEEIIVVPDGNPADAQRQARQIGVRVLEATDAARGPAHARNRGARAAHGQILFFTDADVVVPKDVVRNIKKAFLEDPSLDALIGSYDDAPGAPNFLSQYRNLLHHYVHQTSNPEASTFWGACGAIRRDVFLQVGGFDEAYEHPSIEDIELGYRLKQNGHRIALRKELRVKHLKRWTPFSIVKTDFLRRALPWTELILQRQTLPNDLNLDSSSRISTIAAYGLLGGAVGTFWWPAFGLLALACALTLFGLNFPLYRFFVRKRSVLFAAKAVPWHWLYYLYSGLAFGIGLARHVLSQWGPGLPSPVPHPDSS